MVHRGRQGLGANATSRGRAPSGGRGRVRSGATRVAGVVSFHFSPATGQLRMTNQMREVLGFEPGDTINDLQAYMDRLLIHPADHESMVSAAESIPGSAPLDLLYRIRRPVDGRIAVVRGAVDPPEGERDWVLGTLQDVTVPVHAERERENLIEALEAKNAELELFTYTVSHDLLSPLVTIQGYVGLLGKDLEAGDNEAGEGDLVRIGEAASTMDRLLGDLLELSRIGQLIDISRGLTLDEGAPKADC